jgi:hypothetical protein
MSAGGDQLVPSNTADAPESVIARQKVEEAHDTEIIPGGPSTATFDHLWPSKTKVFPSRLTATQNFRVAHDTSSNRSLSPPGDVCWVDHDWPSNVANVLAAPAVPFAPTAAQKVTVGHETL